MSGRKMPRRDFIRAAGVVGAGWALGGGLSARSYGRVVGANDRLNVAVIGAGGHGGRNLAVISGEAEPVYADAPTVSGTQVVALCDVDLRREGPRNPPAAVGFDNFPDAAKYHDYRRMFDEMAADIDAVVVSTPNHSHAPASVTAMRLGKHVYCEKPGAHSVYEARVMAEVAAAQGVATQLGTQVHSSENFRRVVELIRAGAIGEVTACHIWRRGGTASEDRPTDRPDVPSRLHWDLWLGPAPYRPYHPNYLPTRWHRWWDFGGGHQLGNMGCHFMDLPFWALDLTHPTKIEAEGTDPPHPDSAPAQQQVRYTFPPANGRGEITLTWTHGSEPRAVFAEQEIPDWAWGVFVGSEGMLLASYPDHELWPRERFADYQPPEPSIPPSVGHHQEWVNACKGEGETLCDFGYSMRITEAVLLGNVAYRSGRTLEWDAENLRIPNAHEAEGYLQRGYRPGWTL